MKAPVTLAALAAASALILAGCSSADSASTTDGAQLRVVATTTQLTDFVEQVGGDDVTVTGLLAPGGSAHHFDPTPADLLAIGEADVLVVNGAGLELFVEDAIEAAGFDGTVITAADGIDLAEAEHITAEGLTEAAHEEEHDHSDHDHGDHDEHDHADADAGHDDHEAAEEHDHADGDDHGDHDHADHDHGDLDPHLWTSPRMAEGMVAEIAEGLGEVDPAHAAAYTDRADAYIERLAALDAWVAAEFEKVPEADRVLVTGHDSMRYYLHDYRIEFAGSLLPSFDDNAEPSAAEIDELIDAIAEHGVRAIFVESSLSPKLAQAVAQDAGIRVVDESSLFVDSLGPEGSGAESYIDATVHNTTVILEAWGVVVDPVPSDLR